MIAVLIMGMVAALGFPRMRTVLQKTNVRSARVAVGTLTATAVIHFTSGTNGRVWVSACPRQRPGPGTVDTIGTVEWLASRDGVTLTATQDSIRFDPRGLSMDNQITTVRITGAVAGSADSAVINQLGKVVR
jgi:Tfp pilus assembly protein FimT